MKERLFRWFLNTKSALKRGWWWWIAIFLSEQVLEVAKHRFYSSINDAIDAHSTVFLQRSKPALLYLVTNPLLVSLLVFLVVVCVVLVHAYWDTLRPEEGDERTESGAVDARARKEIYRIDWRYLPMSPLDRGWKVEYQAWDPEPRVEFLAPVDNTEAGGLRIETDKKYAIQFTVPTDYGNSVDELEFSIKYGRDAMFWIGVNVTSQDGVSQRISCYLKILVGNRSPESPKEWPTEHLVWVTPDQLPNGWRAFRIRLSDLVSSAIGSRGLVYESVRSIRIRGCISVSPIKFLSSNPTGSVVPKVLR